MLAIFLLEFGQYWMHRLMHAWRPFWLTHAPHHHITQLNAAKGAVGNPIELFLISLSVLALFDFKETALFAAFNTMSVISVFAHANVRSNPPIWYSFFFTTIPCTDPAPFYRLRGHALQLRQLADPARPDLRYLQGGRGRARGPG